MRLFFYLFAFLGLALAPNPAGANECLIPTPLPTIANGIGATEADMAASHKAVQSFVNNLETYQACIEQEMKSGADADSMLRMAWRAQGNAAVDLANDLAADYAEQYQIFKSHR